jgi:hypothetical protein
VSAADWEVVELNAGLLEDMLLSQVRCMCYILQCTDM